MEGASHTGLPGTRTEFGAQFPNPDDTGARIGGQTPPPGMNPESRVEPDPAPRDEPDRET